MSEEPKVAPQRVPTTLAASTLHSSAPGSSGTFSGDGKTCEGARLKSLCGIVDFVKFLIALESSLLKSSI